ncbi:MAG: sulfatase-like hydrolase/transferase [Lachnospiraceae bacterium]|uniref:Phosphoglycerol transferase I n=1 Tax=[Ruminococcus] torques TaxID=33039 RepID=A0A6N3G7G7_9FIRM
MLKKILHGTGVFISLLLITLATLLSFSISWMFKTWTNLSMDELVYHLTAPIEGTNEEMILNYLQSCLVPTILILLSVIILYITFLKKKSFYLYIGSGSGIAIVVLIVALTYAWNQLDVGNYLKNQNVESDFIEQYYVNPEETVITFPEIKRNLIYIYLESMEVTYTDEKNGGAFDEDVIPELTQIAQDNEDFSGTDSKLNGGYAFPGTTWTMAAMFAQTSGLPLNVSIGQNNMDTQESFLPGITALGDILEQNEYSRTLMIGSDATFGGRALYFTDHGNYDLEDYNYAIEQGWIPSDYRVWWGYEDERLFQNAKNKLMELSAQEEPFNLTLLTVDTHFEDGYVCDICPDKFGDNQYANVMACSSKQVADFINWIQQQDFYENTTIVISGDHPTMDSDFCNSVSEDYQRKVYTAILNSAVEPQLSERREFSTFDMFLHTATFRGHQGRVLRPDRAILSGQS